MAIEWIRANLALRYAAHDDDEYSTQRRIIERAHAGLIPAKAESLLWGDTTEENCKIPKAFWRTDELSDDLHANWEQGDFVRSSRYEVEEQALGVYFDFEAIADLVPAERQAEAMRQISLSANPDWISASDLRQALYALHGPMAAASAILEACQLSQIAGRADRMVRIDSKGVSKLDPISRFGAMAWDIPLWFWRDFVKDSNVQQWSINKLHGSGRLGRMSTKIELQGVHFHRSGLVNLGLENTDQAEAPKAKSGRKPTYDWPAACLAIFGDIHRGELKPQSQADVERALISYLSNADKGPSESTVRPFAKQIWEESQKA